MNYSPLRYPGGKTKLYGFVKSCIENCDVPIDTYIEPFAGGAGIALALLFERCVKKIIINDLNLGVYSFWYSICNRPDDFLRMLSDVKLDMETYCKQKSIYNSEIKNAKKGSLELGFSTFFLNRVNFSGIIAGGPIGGYEQAGKYKLDARFNKKDLAKKIEKIAENSKKIKIFKYDILEFNEKVTQKTPKSFVYFDPPYYLKGKKLYTNFLNHEDHKKIHDSIISTKQPWLLTYDDAEQIFDIYSDSLAYKYNLAYTISLQSARQGTELMYFSNQQMVDKMPGEIKQKINLIKAY